MVICLLKHFLKLKSNCEPKQVYTEDGTIEKNPIKVVHVARDFFEKKFKRMNISHQHLEKFLDRLPVLEDDDLDRLNLMKPADLDELYDTIMSFKNGRLPSLDGLTIEFYKKTFEVIKHQLLNFVNDSIFGRPIPRKINTGVLKLIYKEGDEKDLSNYRPITLINVDLKIITKLFTNRLKPILEKVLHPDQFAQPGKQISELNCLIRDILEEMENGDQDNFFIRFDFEKAFDSLDHEFLFRCLYKMNFPQTFIEFLKKLYNNAVSKVMVNGFISRSFKLSRGSRQGDPLSLYIFIIVLNALIIYLNLDVCCFPYVSRSNKKYLTQAFADDLNVSTSSLTTILRIFRHLEEFRETTGLTINLNKTKGYFFDKTGLIDINHLPLLSTNWNNNMKILGIPYGRKEYVNDFWKNIVKDLRSTISD